ncbi:nuclear transport factor 2 family protein [Ferrovibrio sp.]|uniref:nuclear transport factor 2 family protein n=1 Tax=Ferrovibrio sp. TaxID=1917215 RepID=UPI0025B8A7C7|nr:nuclear transport factor 2 family protein [Ferrovibrio sp.]
MNEQGILDLEAKRLEATIGGNLQALDEYLGDTLVYIHTNGICDSKQSLIKSIADGMRKYTKLAPRKSDVRRFGEIFIITGEMDISYIARGTSNDATIMFSATWYAEARSTHLVSWQSSPSTFRS